MWYNLFPLILIFICGIVVIYIVTKKFPAVANLDLESFPKEKEKRAKQQIISNRLKRNLNKWYILLKKIIQPVVSFVSEFIKESYKKLLSARDNLSKSGGSGNDVTEISSLFLDAQEATKEENYNEAEKIYIHIISLDSKNSSAFKMLGQLYLKQGKVEEAKETLEHALKLTSEDAELYGNLAEVSKEKGQLERAKKHYEESIKLNNENGHYHFSLAEIHKSQNNLKESLKSMKEALKIEPKNPRYLDAMFEISIIAKDKAEALDAYKTLKSINPENGKLGEMKKQIDEL